MECVMVRIYEEIYSRIRPIVELNRMEYPNLQTFVNKAVWALIKKEEAKIKGG